MKTIYSAAFIFACLGASASPYFDNITNLRQLKALDDDGYFDNN